ncbi:hypothetical protein [Asticcacaulis taihuensis]|uniref:hypothetical protein n=1 Tax=Asticcacaulis taihuensis TaxID=260084 RepID=UPI0026EC6FF4|nr:hypothetical protein [Asticcacaulis taihuensis]
MGVTLRGPLGAELESLFKEVQSLLTEAYAISPSAMPSSLRRAMMRLGVSTRSVKKFDPTSFRDANPNWKQRDAAVMRSALAAEQVARLLRAQSHLNTSLSSSVIAKIGGQLPGISKLNTLDQVFEEMALMARRASDPDYQEPNFVDEMIEIEGGLSVIDMHYKDAIYTLWQPIMESVDDYLKYSDDDDLISSLSNFQGLFAVAIGSLFSSKLSLNEEKEILETISDITGEIIFNPELYRVSHELFISSSENPRSPYLELRYPLNIFDSLKLISDVAKRELRERGGLVEAREQVDALQASTELTEAVAKTSPVIATIFQSKIDVANGPANAKPLVIDPQELHDLLGALRQLAEYLLTDLSHQSCNLNPVVRREIFRFQKGLQAHNPIWYVLDDCTLALKHCLMAYHDDPWPGASRDYLERLILRTQQLKPLLKPEPKVEVAPPQVSDEAVTEITMRKTINVLEDFADSPEAEDGLTDSAREYITETAKDLKEAQITGADSDKKKGKITIIAGFIWSAFQVAGTTGRTVEGITKLVPHLQALWQWFSRLFVV